MLYSPYSSHPRKFHCSKNTMFCFHWWLTIHQWTDFQCQISSYVQNPVLNISLFSAESGQHSKRKVPCFTNKVLEWYKHMFQIHNFPLCRQSSVHSSANYIHCSVKLSVLISQFTIIHNSHPKLFPICPIKLSSWAFSFSLRIVDWVRSNWAPMEDW